jgi:hypothetical protein
VLSGISPFSDCLFHTEGVLLECVKPIVAAISSDYLDMAPDTDREDRKTGHDD